MNKNISPARSSLRVLLGFLLKHKKAMFGGFLALIGVDGLQIIVPKLTQLVVDGLASGQTTISKLWVLAGAIVAVSIGMGICRFLWRYFIIRASHKIERDIRQDLYDHLLTLSPPFYDRTKVGDIMAHATNDLNAVRMATGIAALASLDALILTIASISIMVSMNATLTVLVLIPLPLLTFTMLRFGRLVHKRFLAVQEAFSRLSEKAQEGLSGIRVIKAYGDEESEEGYFSEKAYACLERNVSLARIWGLFGPLIGALALASMAILLAAGGRMVIFGDVSLGEMVAFSSYLDMLIWPMMAVGWVVNIVQRGTASMDRLQKLFQTPPDITDGDVERTLVPRIKIDNLTFTYPNTSTPVLRDISFSLPANGTLGIVGRTGSGKTTLAELLMRLYDPPDNAIFIDNEDIRHVSLSKLRGLFGYVPQETFLFAMSIAENMNFGLNGPDEAMVETLGKVVHLDDEIRSFPDGYGTVIGERGVTLSGGQKQRVAIARALALNPSILILDDALSSVDTETEAAILERLKDRLACCTNICISHRISTVRDAELILVLDEGRIVDKGTHDELIQRPGYYAELFRMQQLEEDEFARIQTSVEPS